MDAYNNRIVGSILFTAAPATDNHYTISIETTVVNGPFSLTPWTMYEEQKSGFNIDVSPVPRGSFGLSPLMRYPSNNDIY